jgi:hypothetical protein
MRTLLLMALLGSCAPTTEETAAQAADNCRQARELSESVAGIRAAQNQRPAMPPELKATANEACRFAERLKRAN